MLMLFRSAWKFFLTLLLFIVLGKVLFLSLNPSLGSLLLSESGWGSILWGVRLDATAAAALALIVIMVYTLEAFLFNSSVVTRSMLLIGVVWCLLTTMVDGIYMADVGRHITFEIFTGNGLEDGLIMTALIQYPWHVLAGIVLIAIGGWWVKRLHIALPDASRQSGLKVWMGGLLFWLIWIAFSVTLIRGGWNDAPQSPMTVYRIGNPEQAKVAWNAPYAITYYLSKGKKKAAHRVTNQTSAADMQVLESLLTEKAAKLDGLRQADIVLVLLESWTAADLYSYAGRVDAAPFFDSLRRRSLTTSSMYADGYRTVEGMFSVFCSFPNPIGGGVAGTQLQGLPYGCLPKLLRESGWDTRFIQGSGRGIVGEFAQSLGFEHSYGKTDFNFEGELNYWGYMDDDIYRFALEKITEMQSPFFVGINTGTTHDTFLPNESDYIFGRDDPIAIRRAVTRHADRALEIFIGKLLEQLKRPALVVLVADHTKTGNAPGLEGNAIPFLAFATDGSLPAKRIEVAASQRDISPTIMDWLGGYVPWFSGKSLLSDGYTGQASFSNGQQVTWVEEQKIFRFDAVSPDLDVICSVLGERGMEGGAISCDFTALQRGVAYTRYTQDLLFRGCTQAYGQLRAGIDVVRCGADESN